METHDIPARLDSEDLAAAAILDLIVSPEPDPAEGWRPMQELLLLAQEREPELTRTAFLRRCDNRVDKGLLEKRKVGKRVWFRVVAPENEDETE